MQNKNRKGEEAFPRTFIVFRVPAHFPLEHLFTATVKIVVAFEKIAVFVLLMSLNVT